MHSRIAGRAEEPKMHQTSWRLGLCPGPHGEAHSAPANPLAGAGGQPGRGGEPSCPRTRDGTPWLSHLGLEFRSFGPLLTPAMLISFRRHCVINNYDDAFATERNNLFSNSCLRTEKDCTPAYAHAELYGISYTIWWMILRALFCKDSNFWD